MFGLSDSAVKLLKDYFTSQPQIQEVRVYGSRAMGTQEPGSDIDLAIWTTAERNISGHIKSDLDELPLPYLFDVTDYTRVKNVALKAHVDRVGKALFRR